MYDETENEEKKMQAEVYEVVDRVASEENDKIENIFTPTTQPKLNTDVRHFRRNSKNGKYAKKEACKVVKITKMLGVCYKSRAKLKAKKDRRISSSTCTLS